MITFSVFWNCQQPKELLIRNILKKYDWQQTQPEVFSSQSSNEGHWFVMGWLKLPWATYKVFLDIRATVKDLTDLGSLDHLVQQLPPVQRDHSHDDGVLHELKNVTVVDQAHLWYFCRGCGSSVCKVSWIKVPQKRCISADMSLIPSCGLGVKKNPSFAIYEANIEVSAW